MSNSRQNCLLQGWLKKKRQDSGSFSMFQPKEDERWFRIQEVQGISTSELALCYFKTKEENEARGWIYLKDVTEIFDQTDRGPDRKSKNMFTIVSPARSLTMEASSASDLVVWLQTLRDNCPTADVSNIHGNINFLKNQIYYYFLI